MAVKLLAASAALLAIAMARAGHHAHSFQHFHGPVLGDDKEVMWMDEHGKQHKDYTAPAHYEFAYGVEDHDTGDYHGQKEQRDGKGVAGEYTVKEPNGNIRVVKYHADEDGFHATIHNSHGNEQHVPAVSNGQAARHEYPALNGPAANSYDGSEYSDEGGSSSSGTYDEDDER